MAEYRAATDNELEACVQLQQLVFRPDEPDSLDRYRSYVARIRPTGWGRRVSLSSMERSSVI
ncbi:MAG: hypothetical protein CME19_21400 [Gemmatimonadetes bacterium]|nr:hypothetical protein [Gemmatimonadota bacterium]